MKTLLAICLVAAATCASASTNSVGAVGLAWDDPNPVGTVDAYCIYHSTNAAVPLTNWVKVATVTTNGAVVNVTPGPHFFFATCSNWWGESDPSNVVGTNTPAVLLPLVLRINRLSRVQ